MANETLASGDGSASIIFECNNASEWQTANGTVVPGIICVAEGYAFLYFFQAWTYINLLFFNLCYYLKSP